MTLTIIEKKYMIDVWQDPKYVFDEDTNYLQVWLILVTIRFDEFEETLKDDEG